jgi:AcrR family transcriptional regulator
MESSLPEFLKPATSVGRRRLSREVVRAHQRDRILSVAIEVFAKRGYPGTTVGHIVAAAKIGAPTFQTLFGSKEECFLQAYDRIVAAARERIVAAVPSGDPWPQRLAAAMKALLELIEEWPLPARLVLVEAQTAGAAALDRYERNLDEVASLLRQGREHGEMRQELPATLEFGIVGGLFWFLEQRVTVGEATGAATLLPDVLEIVAEPYLGLEATRELIAEVQGQPSSSLKRSAARDGTAKSPLR